MASRRELTRNNVRAGVFVTVSLLLLLGVLVVLTDTIEAVTRNFDRYTVVYPVEQGVGNLQAGSVVRVGGVQLGRVTRVRPMIEEGTAFEHVAVEFRIDSSVDLYADATVLVTSPLIGAESWLDIPNVGTLEAGPPKGDVIEGTPAAGMLTTLVGPQIAGEAGLLVANAKQFSELLARFPADYDRTIAPALDDARATAADVRAVAGDLRQERWPRWAGSVDDVMTWATEATEQLDAALAEGQGLLGEARAMVDESREPVGAIVSNVEAASADVRAIAERAANETMEKVHAVLDRGTEALEQADGAIRTVREDYAGWTVDVDDLLGNVSLAGQQLKFFTAEVRRSPWKLLYRPSADELEHELLYEAARSFAVAAADLKATAQAVDRITTQYGDRLVEGDETLQRLSENLEHSLANYERAQEALFDVLVSP